MSLEEQIKQVLGNHMLGDFEKEEKVMTLLQNVVVVDRETLQQMLSEIKYDWESMTWNIQPDQVIKNLLKGVVGLQKKQPKINKPLLT